jgi:hypothetical protein
MFVAVNHTVTDPQKWEEASKRILSTIEAGKLPQGLKPVCYLPSADGRRANCVWEADKIDDVKRFLSQYLTGVSKDEFFQVNAELAMGIPAHAPEGQAVPH